MVSNGVVQSRTLDEQVVILQRMVQVVRQREQEVLQTACDLSLQVECAQQEIYRLRQQLEALAAVDALPVGEAEADEEEGL
mgnify:CR=1 FL=1